MRHLRGFTLGEILAAMTLASVLFSLGVPSFRKLVLDSRRTAVLNDLLGSIQTARSESFKRSGYVTLCPSADGLHCSGSDGWGAGWIIYLNTDRNDAGVEPDPGEPVLHAVQNETDGVRVSTGGRRSFTFRPFLIHSDNGTFTVCDDRGAAAPQERRAIIINSVGRPRLSTLTADGMPLDCS